MEGSDIWLDLGFKVNREYGKKKMNKRRHKNNLKNINGFFVFTQWKIKYFLISESTYITLLIPILFKMKYKLSRS